MKGDPIAELKNLMSSEPNLVAFGAPWLYVHGEPVWWKTLKIEIPRKGKGTGQEWTLGLLGQGPRTGLVLSVEGTLDHKIR